MTIPEDPRICDTGIWRVTNWFYYFYYYYYYIHHFIAPTLILILQFFALTQTVCRPDISPNVLPLIQIQIFLSVCLCVTLVSPAKVAEPIEMLFGLRTWVGPGNRVLDGGPDPPMGRGNFKGKEASHCKV